MRWGNSSVDRCGALRWTLSRSPPTHRPCPHTRCVIARGTGRRSGTPPAHFWRGRGMTEHDQLPLPDYDHLPVDGLASRIRTLDARGLETVLEYERAHAN